MCIRPENSFTNWNCISARSDLTLTPVSVDVMNASTHIDEQQLPVPMRSKKRFDQLRRMRRCFAVSASTTLHDEMAARSDDMFSPSGAAGVGANEQQQQIPQQQQQHTSIDVEKPVIKVRDIPEHYERLITSFAAQGLKRYWKHVDIAAYIRRELEHYDNKEYGNWHVVVGNRFGASNTYQANRYIYFYIKQLGFLVFKY